MSSEKNNWLDAMQKLNKINPEGATCAEIAEIMGVRAAAGRVRLQTMIKEGICECAGRALRANITGSMTMVPVYRLTKKK